MKSAIFVSVLAVAAATPLAHDNGYGSYKSYGDYKNVGGHYEGNKGCPAPAPAPKMVFNFDAVYNIVATPEQVVNASNIATGGLKGAVGYYNYGINSALDTICYNITLVGVTGAYQSMALTATHIHQAAKGLNGPPRVAIPNPAITGEMVGGKEIRRAAGCLTGPFKTGIMANNSAGVPVDTGAGFKVSQIVANPAGFFTDVHVAAAVPGAVRGQVA